MTITISTGAARAEIEPELGGRVAALALGGTELLVARDSVPDSGRPLGWGSYPMVPWAGRVRDGRFTFRGAHLDLPRNHGPHAVHGVGFTSPWEVVGEDATSVELRLVLPTDARWPYGGVAQQVITVEAGALLLDLSVRAEDRAFPAEVGWHPWFRKPDSIDLAATAMYRRDAAGIAVDELVPVPDGPWDDCFVNTEPVLLAIGGVRIRLTSDCDHWVVYDERPWATCVEPQTGPPDAFNIRPRILDPGDELTAWYRIALVDQPSPTGR